EKDNEEITDAKKTDAENTEVTKGDREQAGKLPLTSSILSVSSNFGNQFLNLSSDTSLIGITKKFADTKINSLLDIQIQQEVPHIQSSSVLTVLVLVTPEPHSLSTYTPEHKALFHDFIESLLADGEGIDQGVTDSLKKKRQHDHQDEGPSAGPNQGIMDTANDNVVNDVDQPQDESIPKTTREPRNDWFTQPPRPPTPDLEWNKGKEVDNGQEKT
ncbi:hypothetical protein Tco_1520983, partial [Tanacetum coccineum]